MPLVNGLLNTARDVAKAALRDIFETPRVPQQNPTGSMVGDRLVNALLTPTRILSTTGTIARAGR
jgi:hypothetical protein